MKPSSTERRRSVLTAALLAAVVGGGWVGECLAQERRVGETSASEAAQFLVVPLGGRNVALGGAAAGASGDVEGALWNPAALAAIDRWAIHYHGANDFGTSTHAIGGVVPWGSVRVGIALLAMDLGTLEARDAANQPLGTIEPSNMLAVLTVARPISRVFEAGVSYKLVRQGGSCRGCGGLEPDATGHAVDAALTARIPSVDGLRLGIVLSNLGGAMALRSDGPTDPLPARVRVGGEWLASRLSPSRDVGVRVRADLRQTFTEFDDLDVLAGVEAGYRDTFFLRAGYAEAGEGRSGPSLGVGIAYEGFSLDVGRSFDDFAGFDEDSPFLLSLSYRP